MLDHARKWDPAPNWQTAVLLGRQVVARTVDLHGQFLVSGDLATFSRLTGLDATGVGALGHATDPSYTIRLARDRLLVVGAWPPEIQEGWNEAGFAATAIGGADHVFEFVGEGVADLLSIATSVDASQMSASASLGFASVPAIAYRYGPAAALRVHVDRGLAAYVWTWLTTIFSEGKKDGH